MKKIEINSNTKALIFDIDGTLVDTMPSHFRCWQELGRIKGFEYPKSLFDKLAGAPTTTIVETLNAEYGYNLDPVKTSKQKEEIFLEMVDTVKSIEPVVDVARFYYGKLPMALGTGSKKHVAKRVIDAVGIGDLFDVLISIDDVENCKPAPDTFLKCAQAINVLPKYCQVFEDGERGIESAKNAGMMVIDVRDYL